MKIGKVPNSMLQDIILGKIKNKRNEVIMRPKIGEDCCAVEFGEYACVMSCDPITGAANEIGWLAVHVSCNDVASCGVEPLGLLVTILAPPGTSRDDLAIIIEQLNEAADSINVDIIGGHTEITASVNKFVIVTTAIGRALKNKLITSSGAKPGDDIILTKTAGLEGTAIIAHDRERELTGVFGDDMVNKAKDFKKNISVVKESIIASEYGVSAMHDVTEGGVLGAAWELARASAVGICLYKDKIPIAQETLKITQYYGIDPLKLISSGCMLITCKNGQKLVDKLNENGIEAAVIGHIPHNMEKVLISGEVATEIGEPEPDELYKVV